MGVTKQSFKIKNITENKYSLKFSDITKLKVIDKQKFIEKAWRNEQIKAWCMGTTVRPYPKDMYGTYDEDFWLGLYDDGHLKAYCTSYGGMCGYEFEEFYTDVDKNEAIAKIDTQLHSNILKLINELIDIGALSK